jgi:hypothetical protein
MLVSLARPTASSMAGMFLRFCFRVLWQAEIKGQLVDLARELERTIIAILEERNPGAGIHTDVEVFAFRERDGSGVIHVLPVPFLAVQY